MRKKLLSMLVLLTAAAPGAWAQDTGEVAVDETANTNEWTLVMPASDVELQIEYYTDEEVAQMEEAAFTEGVELTANGDGTWTLDKMPAFDIELQVEYEKALALSETADNTEALTEWDGYEADVTLTRTLQTGGYNTFAVPFSMDIPSGWTVKELTDASFSEGTLTLYFGGASSIVAGKPYLVKVSEATDLSEAAITGVISKDAAPFTSTAVDFIPTLGKTTINDNAKNVLFLGSGNTLYYPTSLPGDIKGFRAYFLLKGEAKQADARTFVMNFGDGETTGIRSLTPDGELNGNESVYTLDGRRIDGQPTQKGVYIVNGKKVIK